MNSSIRHSTTAAGAFYVTVKTDWISCQLATNAKLRHHYYSPTLFLIYLYNLNYLVSCGFILDLFELIWSPFVSSDPIKTQLRHHT